MAQRVETILIDDIDGSSAAETVNFALDGVNYAVSYTHLRAHET